MEMNGLSALDLPKGGEKAECLDENYCSSLPDSFLEKMENNTVLQSLCNLYAVIVVAAGFMVLTEVLHTSVPLFYLHEYLFIFLLSGGIICLCITYARAWSYRSQVSITNDSKDNMNKSMFCFNSLASGFPTGINKFFRIGTIVFGFAMLTSCVFEALSIFTMQGDCTYDVNSIQPILLGLFTLLEMLFLFLNFREIINTFGWFRHIAMMHLIATNLAVFIQILLQESAMTWLYGNHYKHNSSVSWIEHNKENELNITIHTLESDLQSSNSMKHILSHKVHFTSNCYWSAETNETESLMAYNLCLQNSIIGIVWEKVKPFMYPVTVQFILCISGIIYFTWSNKSHLSNKSHRIAFQSNYMQDSLPKFSDTSTYAGSTKGLFIGVFILIVGIIMTTIFYAVPEKNGFDMTLIVGILQCVIFCISSLAAVLGLFQLQRRNYVPVQLEKLHIIFLKIGLIAVYSYGVCNAIAGCISTGVTNHIFVGGILMIVHAITQSLFLEQVLRKNLYSKSNRKPKAQIVSMLAVVNVMLWIMDSFVAQNHSVNRLQIAVFGKVAWPVLSKVLLPIVAFYRFHSAVMLMEVWKRCYAA